MPDRLDNNGEAGPAAPRDPQGAMAGSYRIARPMAQGTMGIVYLAEHPRIGAKAAVKVLREELAGDRGLVDRFVEEARAAAVIRHPNMVRYYDLVYLPDGRPATVMELLDGRGLDQALASGAFPLAEAIDLVSQVCAVLASTHARGAVHRDIKAEHVLLAKGQDGRERAKVLDFGLAAVAGRSLPTIPGKPHYLAPELIRGEEIDARADFYAVGVLAYQLLAGRFPFQGRSPREIARKHVYEPVDPEPLPAAARDLVLKLLAKGREGRFADDAALASALRALEASLGLRTAAPLSRAGRDAPTEPDLAPFLFADTPEPGRAPAWPSESEPPSEETPEPAEIDGADSMADPIPDPIVDPPDEVVDVTVVQQTLPEPPPPTAEWKAPETAEPAPGGAGGSPAGPLSGERPPGDSVEEALLPDLSADRAIGDSPTLPGVEFSQVARALGGGAEDASAERGAAPGSRLLARFLELSERDHYSFLSIPEDADSDQVKDGCARVEQELLALRDQVWPAQRPQVVALLGRLERARRVLDDLEARAAYDARRGNHRGVARCMAAGLAPARVDKLRQDYIRRSPELVDRARKLAQEAQEHAENGGVERAALVFSQALALDPLSRELQRRLEELLQPGDGPA